MDIFKLRASNMKRSVSVAGADKGAESRMDSKVISDFGEACSTLFPDSETPWFKWYSERQTKTEGPVTENVSRMCYNDSMLHPLYNAD